MKKYITFILVLSLAAAAFACTAPAADHGFTTDYPLDEYSYTLWLNKEINTVCGQTSSAAYLTAVTGRGNYPKEDFQKSLRSSIDIIAVCIAEVENMMPATDYEEARKETLRLMTNCQNTMQALLNECEDGTDVKYTEYASLLQSDMVALSAMFNIYYQGV